MVVGNLVGSGEAQERGVVGETPNLGARDLKGIAGPVRAWTALRPSAVESRFEALHASGLTELVGREEELELLLRRWSKAKTGDGQVVHAIAQLCSDTVTKAPAAEAPSTSPKPPQDTAERRQVTVMFSDLIGSTALSARMDPEDLREVIFAYQKCVAQVVQHFGGYVARFMGDGVLIFFGYPQAHEDDAEQAVPANWSPP